jgi:hypothetical protein
MEAVVNKITFMCVISESDCISAKKTPHLKLVSVYFYHSVLASLSFLANSIHLPEEEGFLSVPNGGLRLLEYA